MSQQGKNGQNHMSEMSTTKKGKRYPKMWTLKPQIATPPPPPRASLDRDFCYIFAISADCLILGFYCKPWFVNM